MIILSQIYNNASGIYVIKNLVNNNIYIGSAINLSKRIANHRSRLIHQQHNNPHLQAAWNKYGEENFEAEVLFTCPKSYLIKLEQFFINNYNPQYNIAKVAGSCLGIKRSEETKEKYRLCKLGTKQDLDHVEARVRSLRGRKQSVEHINKRLKPLLKELNQYSQDGVLLKTWPSLKSVETENGMKISSVSSAIRRGSITYGYIWKYKEN